SEKKCAVFQLQSSIRIVFVILNAIFLRKIFAGIILRVKPAQAVVGAHPQHAVIVANQRIDLVIGKPILYCEMREIILLLVIAVQTSAIGSYPKCPFLIQTQTPDVVMVNALFISGNIDISFPIFCLFVVPTQSVFCTCPDISISIFGNNKSDSLW